MTRAYMKFFTWHVVRWDDSPAISDPRAVRTLAANLKRKVTWAAPHIAGGDATTWLHVLPIRADKGRKRVR